MQWEREEREERGREEGRGRGEGKREEEGEESGVVLTWGVALYWMSFWREERAIWTICGFFVSHANSRGWTTSSVSARTRRQKWE